LIGALVAAKTPRDIAARLNKEINAAVASPDVRSLPQARRRTSEHVAADFEAMIKQELVSNAQLIKPRDKSRVKP